MSSPEATTPLARLQDNLRGLDERIKAAQARGAAAATAVERLVVTKSQPPGIFPLLVAAGIGAVGENRVQSALARRGEAPSGLVWHGIGHLQRNKAADAVRAFDVFHALDSLRLAAQLEAVLEGCEQPWPVYVQVNAAEDPAKGGFAPGEVRAALSALALHEHLAPIGFMTMAAIGAQESDLRRTFRTLRDVRDEAVRRGLGVAPPTALSMGMSSDFEIAVEEGATSVRLGRAVFEGVDISSTTHPDLPSKEPL